MMTSFALPLFTPLSTAPRPKGQRPGFRRESSMAKKSFPNLTPQNHPFQFLEGFLCQLGSQRPVKGPRLIRPLQARHIRADGSAPGGFARHIHAHSPFLAANDADPFCWLSSAACNAHPHGYFPLFSQSLLLVFSLSYFVKIRSFKIQRTSSKSPPSGIFRAKQIIDNLGLADINFIPRQLLPLNAHSAPSPCRWPGKADNPTMTLAAFFLFVYLHHDDLGRPQGIGDKLRRVLAPGNHIDAFPIQLFYNPASIRLPFGPTQAPTGSTFSSSA